MKLYIASDHAGTELKALISERFKNFNSHQIEWTDLGPQTKESVDYPLFAKTLAQKILTEFNGEELLQQRGILICGSGVGMSIAANRHKCIRAVLAYRHDIARLSREHNASNVLCLGARIIPDEEALGIIETWLTTPFAGDRHLRRVNQMDE